MTSTPDENGIVAPKKPQDRKVKASDDYRVKYRNRVFVIEKDALDDIELLEDLNAADKGNVQVLPSMLLRLIGKEQRDKAYELLRNKETGRVKSSEVSQFVADIFSQIDPKS